MIVLREGSAGCEVLFVQRHAASRAFGGAHVFPGGVVDAADAAPALQAASPRLSGDAAAARLREPVAGGNALAFWIAAIRELFEEAGILLADVDGRPLAFADPAVRARYRDERAALLAGTLAFPDLVARAGLALATDRLAYWSRWITPVTVPRRYDARFFVARLPEGQEPLHDERETIATAWHGPEAALAEARAGRMVLTPPTMRTLEDLAMLGTTERIFAAAATRTVAAVLPKPVSIDGRMAILYPGDADYARAVPGAALVETPDGPHDRVVMDGGAWRSIRSGA